MNNRVINFNNVLNEKKEAEELKKKIEGKEVEKKTFYLLEKDASKNNSKKDVVK
jgi:hypothetical protein